MNRSKILISVIIYTVINVIYDKYTEIRVKLIIPSMISSIT